MAKTAVVTLGGVDYTVHAFNLDELQEVGEIIGDGSSPTGGMAIRILKVALRRATPPLPVPGEVEAEDFTEVQTATSAVMKLAGLVTDTPQTAAPVVS